MQEHLSLPTYCNTTGNKFRCQASACLWLHKVVLNLPKFMITRPLFIEQCSFMLVFFFLSCCLFLYALYLTKNDPEIKIRYKILLTIPSLVFELIIGFLLFYSTITSIFEYSRTASLNPEYYSSAFIIFSFIISIFYAFLIVLHSVTIYYIVISPIQTYSPSDTNYSDFQGSRRAHSIHYEGMKSPSVAPLLSDNYGSPVHGWNDTQTTYSQVRSLNGTIRTSRTMNSRRSLRNREMGDNDYEYLEVL
ncbi:unnamed protein product [Caenorhabditis bovis]|uniref:Uncharacterized protein n=1 Tax=Caenorhabditis bovis TaxID=2654633 RepID=A0A8S1F332_9PELO|nr:unnamed protein product [Caenorhabditis bovis]